MTITTTGRGRRGDAETSPLFRFSSGSACRSSARARSATSRWRAARRSARRGSWSPRSAPTSSPTASTRGSSPRRSSASIHAARRRPSGSTTAATSSDLALDPVRPPLLGHLRRGPARRPDAGRAVRFPAGTIWLIAGVVLGGAVQDLLILCASCRRDGKSLGQIAKEEVNPVAGMAAMVAIFAIMIILLAVLGARRRQRAARQPVGPVHDLLHDSDRAAHGLVDEQPPPGQGRGGDGHRHRAAGRRARRRPVGVAERDVGSGVHLVRDDIWRGR